MSNFYFLSKNVYQSSAPIPVRHPIDGSNEYKYRAYYGVKLNINFKSIRNCFFFSAAFLQCLFGVSLVSRYYLSRR